jgi:diguanylate cyclase (GGDEF)-like protein/PAS domain S-box-containing protein
MADQQTLEKTGLEARLDALRPGFDLIGLPACVIDSQKRYQYANAAYAAMSSRTPEDFPGHAVEELFPRPAPDARRTALARALDGEVVILNRQTIAGPAAGRWVRAHYFPLAVDGGIGGVLVVLVDIQQLKDTEEELADQRKQLQLVVDNIGAPMSYVDRDRRFRFANQPGMDWTIRDTAQAIGRRLDEVLDPAAMEVIRPQVEAAFRGEKRTYERIARMQDGAQRWVRVHLVPDIDEGGTVKGVYSLTLDVDSDHRMREALERQEAQLRHFAENIPGPVAVVGADYKYLFVNRHFERLYGRKLEELRDLRVPDVIGPERTMLYFEPHIERLKRGETCTYERLVTPPGGEARWLLVRLVPIMDDAGRFGGYYVVGSDIHDIKLAQEQLAAQESQMRLYTDNIPDAVAYLDRERRILFANRHFAEQRGTTPGDVIGKTTSQLMGGETARWIAERTQRVFDHGETATYEREVDMPGLGHRHFHVKAVPDLDESGGVRGMYVVAHDITEVKEAERLLAAREKDLRFFAENIPEAIVYVDLERGCTFVNNIFLATRGFTREFALGKFPPEVYPPEVMATLTPHLERALQGEESAYERVLRLPTGAERWVRVRVTPRKEDGRVVGYYVVSTDIHEIKVAQAAVEEKERQLRQVIDSIPTPMVYCDAERRYRYVNDAFLEYAGQPAEKVIGRNALELFGEDRAHSFDPVFERVRQGETVATERLIKYADGRERWMFVRLTPRMDEQGRFIGFYSTTSDIHEQKVVEHELRRTNSILSAHFDNTPLAVIEWDTELRVVRWSGQAEAIFGWTAAESLGRRLDGWRHAYEEDADAAARMIRDLVEGRTRHATLLHRNYRKDGSVIWVEWHSSAMRDESGRVISILSLAQDVSSRIQAEERLQYMATHDGLTALPNKVLLNDRLEAALARAHRGRSRVGVMFLDLDHFKDVNDTLGHRVGDLLLKEVSRRIRATLRQSDVLARISGDEFVVVLEDLPDEGAPELVAHKILDEVRRPFQVEGHDIHVSGSLGLSLYPEDGDDAETLLKNADAAMYHAKELGRNAFRMFSVELGERRAHRMRVEKALRRALRDDELQLHFQPIMDVATGRVARAEALLRWQDPDRGLVMPAGFIPLAEETGLGHAVGQWVLEAACKQARAWRDGAVGEITLCVNLSASQLRDAALVADLKKLLARTGCEPGWLEFEITETSMVRDVEGASLTLARLRALGVRIAIDDFGTGYSSLSHLRHLPVDVLKVDRAFVADIEPAPATARPGARRGDRAGGAAIVSAVIGLARGLGLGVVAEGVEKKSQLAFLEKEGCGHCQGYLICPPLPAAEFEAWLLKRRKPALKKKTKAVKGRGSRDSRESRGKPKR